MGQPHVWAWSIGMIIAIALTYWPTVIDSFPSCMHDAVQAQKELEAGRLLLKAIKEAR